MLGELLQKKKNIILDKWREAILASYPPDSGLFLKNQKNQFANPVGYTIEKETAEIIQTLFDGGDIAPLQISLDRLIRIRSVQDFTPSQATHFLFQLKRIIRLEAVAESTDDFQMIAALEERIDRLALVAFDIYSRCREQIYDLRLKEIKARAFRILKDSDLVTLDFKKEGNSPHENI